MKSSAAHTQPPPADSDVGLLLTAARGAVKAGRTEKAKEFYLAVLQSRPDHPEALRRLAHISEDSGNATEAAGYLEKLVAACPADVKTLQELALCHISMGRREEGIAELRRVAAMAPDYATGHCNLGLALEEAGDITGAADCLREALRLDPRSGFIAYHLSAVNAQAGRPFAAPPVCPTEYLLKLFNGYADRFDRHLFQSLRYRGPMLLADIVAEQPAEKLPAKPWDILDLGCGTGMTAMPFRDDARSIVGVDLAPRMLELAGKRTTREGKVVYDDLIKGDLIPVMRSRTACFELILSADVFIYVGDLAAVFQAAHGALRPGGVFAFTIETWHGSEDYRLLPTRRYAHNPKYIQKLTAINGFAELGKRNASIRLGEDQQPVSGQVFLLSRM